MATYESGLMDEKYNKKDDFIEDPLLQMCMGSVTNESGEFKQHINFEKYRKLFYTKNLASLMDQMQIHKLKQFVKII